MYPDSGYKLAHAQSVCTRPFSPRWEPGDETSTYPETLCSLQNACYSHRVQYIRFPPMGVTLTWPELPERALNIIYISLKFLHTFARNPPIKPLIHIHYA